MNYFAFRVSLSVVLIVLSGEAMAIGLGELRGSPALGDRPRFEVDILGSGKVALDPACFRLERPAGDDNLPWLKRATFKVRQGVPPVLEIVSDVPLNDPVLAVAVHVACGQDVVREYLVMASPPSGRSLMAMEPADAPRARVQSPVERERIRSLPPEIRTSPQTATSVPARLPGAGRVPALVEQQVSELAPSDKIKSMEATVGELQQRAGELSQKIEEAAVIPATTQPEVKVTQPAPATDPTSKRQRTVSTSGSSGLSFYGALIGAVLAIAAWLGWRFYQERKQGRQRFQVDPPRNSEHEERGGVDLQVDPIAMVMPSQPHFDSSGVAPTAQTENSVVPPLSLDSTMSISAATVDEHFEANPVMELAEIMLSFGRVKGAAQALQEYIDANPQEALKPWIRLMDVYRMAGMRHEFERVARELNKNFNVEVQKWDAVAATEGQGVVDVVLDAELASHQDEVQAGDIEGMPAIIEQVLIRWPTGDVIEYLNQLLRDNRGGTRLGFSLSVVSDILFLIELKEISNKMESEAKTS